MAIALPAQTSGGVRVVAHSGSTDPSSEGWTPHPGSANPLNVTVGPIQDGGTPAWFADDQSTASGSWYLYKRAITASEVADGRNDGWRLSATLRVVSDTGLPGQMGSPFLEYSDGQRFWQLMFGLDAAGNTQVRLSEGATPPDDLNFGPLHTVPADGAYHTYELVYDPATSRANLSVDGAIAVTGYAGWAVPDAPHVWWGAGKSLDAGRGNFAAVAFENRIGLANTSVDGVIVDHVGATDPQRERWVVQPGFAVPLDVSTGPVDDLGTPAWSVDDRSTVLGSWYTVQREITTAQTAAARARGWTLATRLRVVSDHGTLLQSGSPGVEYYDGQRYWQMMFGLDGSGNTTVRLVTGADGNNVMSGFLHVLPGNLAYHTYELAFDPAAASATLFVDGQQIAGSTYFGWQLAGSPHVIWGADNSFDAGQGNFQAVSFAIGPRAPADIAPPAIAVVAPADGHVTNAPSVSVVATVTDSGATTVTSTPEGVAPGALPAGGGTVSGTLTLVEGPNRVRIAATDSANNASATSIDVYRDTASPVVTVTPAEGTIVSAATQSFSIVVTDQTATRVSVAGLPAGTATVAGGGVYGDAMLELAPAIVLHEGVNECVVVATDAGGNSTTIVRKVILDTSAPIVRITSPADGARYDATAVRTIPLVVAVDDATPTEVSGALVGSLGAGGGTLSGTFVLQEGVNILAVTAANPGLNLSATDTVRVVLDTIPPTTQITTPRANAPVRGTVEFHADVTDTFPGTVTSVTYWLDGQALPAVDLYRIDTTQLADGPHTLRVDAVDSSGNKASASQSILVDNTPPAVVITNPVDLSWVNGSIAFHANVSDAGTGVAAVTMRAAGAAPATDGSREYPTPVASVVVSSVVDTVAASGGRDGDMECEVTVRDLAGNTTKVAVTVHVDNTAPVRAILAPAAGSEVRCVVDVRAAVSDLNLASVRFVVDGIAFPVQTVPPFAIRVDTRDRLDEDMEITLLTTDLAQNVSSTTIHVTVDNLEVKLEPETIELKSKGGGKLVTARIEGQSASLLAALSPEDVTLCVPGGSPIPATRIVNVRGGWRCDHGHEAPHRGHRNGHELGSHGAESGVLVEFDRQLLIGALRGAGLTGGDVEIAVRATRGGKTFDIGADTVHVRSR